jgi:phosphoribosylformylglycinamidine synthase subunit PurL
VAAEQAEDVLARARSASVPVLRIGVTGGDALMLPGERPIAVAQLKQKFEAWLPAYMAGEIAAA